MRPLLLGLALSATSAAPGIAAEPKEPAAAQPSLTDVNKKLSNPVSDLWSITFQQNNYWLTLDSPYDGGRWSSNLLFQPVLPIAISGSWNLITRPVIPIFVSQPHPRQSDPQDLDRTTTFGDTTLLQLVSPGDSLVGKWLLGAGPSWIFPTANSDFTGFGKWQVGPAAIAGYLDEKWIIGALMQQWWSYGGSGNQRTSSMNLQPFAAYFLPDGWSVGYSGNVLADWKAESGQAYTVPIGLQVAKVTKLGPLPVRISLAGQWMPIHPDQFGQKFNIQLQISPVLPKLVRGNLADPSSLSFGLER